jgi:uncharacterized repeat protein (TIGR01451 family)
MARVRRRFVCAPRKLALRCIAYVATMAALGLALPAHAAINQFVQGMSASGTAPFGVDDSSATDTNIRTFDYATYRVGYSITPSDANALVKLTAASFTLPGSYIGPALAQVAFFDAKDLPTGLGGCQNISLAALTAAQITAGNVSGVTANGQTLYCIQPPGIGGNNLDFRMQIRGNAPNGTIVNPPTAEFSSTSNPATTALTSVLSGTVGVETFYGLPPLTIKASPKWNLNKSAIRGALYVPGSGPPGSGPGGVGGANGFVFSWNIGVYAIGTRKGLEALNTAGFTENWSDPDFPNSQLVTWNMQVPGFVNTNITPNNCGNWQNALGVLGNVFDNTYYIPNDYGNVNYSANDYTVARGGTCQSTAINQVAKTASFDLVNTDWSLSYYPVRRGANPAAANIINPINLDDNTNEWWAASKTILIWVPETDIVVPPNPNTAFLTNTANLFGTSVSGQANIEPVLSDNTNQQGATRSLSGGIYKVARPWFYLNNPFGLDLALRDPSITGDSQVHQVAPNQALLSAPQIYNSGTTPFGAGQICDKIDNTRFTLLDTTNPAYVSTYPNVIKDPLTGIAAWYLSGSPSLGPSFVWELGVNTVGTTGGTWNSYNTNANEYASPAQSGSAQSDTGCGDADAIWYPSVAALLAAGRTLQEVTTVRAKYTNWPGSTYVVLGIPQISRSTFAYSSTDIGPGGSAFVAGGSTLNTFSSNQARWDSGVAGLFGNASGVGRASDTVRFFQTEYAQISKNSPTNPNNTLVTPGTQVTYALTVNITTSGSAHTSTVEVWDVLPAGMDYVAGSSTLGGAPLADPVCASSGLPTALFPATVGPPASVAGSTPAGYKACKWVLNNQNVAKTYPTGPAGNLPELRFRAAVALNAPVSPPVLLNTSFADSSLNLYPDAVYDGAQIGFKCIAGQNCFFSNWSLSVAASPGIALSKAVSRSLIAPNSTFTYTLGYGAVGSSLANARILDVLPYVGDARGLGSTYTGVLGLSGPVVVPSASAGPPATSADPTAQVLYTNNTPANINRDPYGPSSLNTHHILNGSGTNSAVNTNWCTSAQFNVGNCPSSFSNVTGVMLLPFAGAPITCGSFGTVPCLIPGALYQASVPVVGSSNTVGNLYNNDFRADSPSLSARAPGSNLVTTRVVAPDLILSKTVSPASVNTGATVVYTLTPQNTTGTNVGIIEAAPAPVIVVTDNLPPNLSIASNANVDGGAAWNCAASTAPSTVSCTYIGALPVPVGGLVGNAITVNAIASSLLATTVTVVNTSTISMTGQTEISTTNNTGSATLLIKPSFMDLVSIVSLPPSATIGSVVTGTVVFANIASGPGAITATNAVGTVTLSNGQILPYSLGDLAPGASVIRTFTTTVPIPAGVTPLVANSNITSTTTTADNNPSNNTSSASLIPLVADVSVTLVLPANAVAGTAVSVTLTFTNVGDSTATSTLGVVSFSNGQTASYNLGALAPGQSIVTTTQVTVPSVGTLTGTATVATSTPEITLTNNISTGAISVQRVANLSVVKDNNATSLLAGTTTAYTVTFSNAGPSPAGGAIVKDNTSSGLACTAVTCTSITGGASCPSNILPLGTSVSSTSTNFFSSGESISNFPANSSVTLRVDCNVTATGR